MTSKRPTLDYMPTEAMRIKPGDRIYVGHALFTVTNVYTHAVTLGTITYPVYLVSITCHGLPRALTVHKYSKIKKAG